MSDDEPREPRESFHGSEESQPDPEREPPASAFPIVGIGASAGGLEAFSQLLQALPVDTGMAFVLIQHLDPRHESRLASILAKTTSMEIVEATDGLEVEPNHVYVIPQNTTLTLKGGALKLEPRGESRGPHLPVDEFLKSLADDQQATAVGVILSGTGSDGALGLAEIKAAGGITFAQDRASARYDGMPQSAVANGSVDFVLAPDEIARELARIGSHFYLVEPGAVVARPPDDEEPFRKILTQLRTAFGVDFAQYRDTTIRRRTFRRMALHGEESLLGYAKRLEGDRGELHALYQDILINVTSFFRDPLMFDVLKETVFPEIMKTKSPQTPIRIWTAGCSTGQEAYSLAMALSEFLDDNPNRPPVQVFATDLGQTTSLDKARLGLYPESIEAEVSPERLRRFFVKEDGKYRIIKSIRDVCVFAKHNLALDPPFSRVDLVSCRNVLIYLAPPLQKRVLPTFHYALNPTGFLMLGASESIGAFSDLFSVVDKAHKIYSKRAAAVRQYPHFNAEVYLQAASGEPKPAAPPAPTPADWQKEADRIVLGQYAPAGVLVDESFEILQFRGRTSPYLEPPPGTPSLNLLKMAREGLFVELKSALAEAKAENATAERRGVLVRDGREVREVHLKVAPVTLHGMGECCFLVLFEQAAPPIGREADEGRGGALPGGGASGWIARWLGAGAAVGAERQLVLPDERDRELLQLRRELAASREQQQHAIEQHEAANEELKSANEEILSSNEELQSTNEELETAKEELQSVNEELTTVNEQLQNRNLELTQSNNDLTNLIVSASIPIVMLKSDLGIRRFTPTAAKVLNLLPADVGRPIGHIKSAIGVADLEEMLEDVIETVQVVEREVRIHDERWYKLRIHPYRTSDNKIDGAVLVFIDVHESKHEQLVLKDRADYTRAIVETVGQPLLILTADLRVDSANEAFHQTFKIAPDEAEGRFLGDLVNGQWDVPRLKALLEDVVRNDAEFQDFRVEADFPDAGRRTMLLNARRLRQNGDRSDLVLLAIEDVTERNRAEARVRASELRYRRLFESAKDGILILDPQTCKITDANPFITELLECSRQDVVGKELWEIGLFQDQETNKASFEKLRGDGYMRQEGLRLETRTGEARQVEVVGNLYKEDGHEAIQCNVRDVTQRKEAEAALMRTTAALSEADARKNEFLAMLAHELRNPLAAISNAVALLNRVESDAPAREWGREVIQRQAGNLSRLVDDLLDVSRITRGKIQLRKEPVEFGPLVARTVAMVRHLIDARGHELSMTLPDEPVWVVADPLRLEQVFANLLNNAAKYTEPGGRIEVEAHLDRSTGEVVATVKDTGAGIEPEMLRQVFDLFTQADPSSDRAQGGLGIGLTVVRSLIERHGGSVSASSELGDGSAFTVRLPTIPPLRQEPPQSTADEKAATSRRILIVDDNPDAAQSMAWLLELAGHQVTTVHDGPSAVEAASTQRPEVVILDVGLPGMDGYEVAARLRRDERCKDAVVIGLSGYGQNDSHADPREVGFDHHLIKPVDHDALIALINQTSR